MGIEGIRETFLLLIFCGPILSVLYLLVGYKDTIGDDGELVEEDDTAHWD